MMTKKHEMVCTTLNDIKNLLILAPIVTDVFPFPLLIF